MSVCFISKFSNWAKISADLLTKVLCEKQPHFNLLTLSSEAMDPSKDFDSLASLGLQIPDLHLQQSETLLCR